ncbi:MAG: STAS domain-containing protein [Planctomycetota bacterium]
MSNAINRLTGNDVAGLPRVYAALSDPPTAEEAERLREQVYAKLSTTSRGIVVDLSEVDRVSPSLLACLTMCRLFAKSERKHLLLYGVSPKLQQALDEHAEQFPFRVFGQRARTKKPEPKPEPRLKPESRKRVLRIALLVGILAPIVILAEILLVYQAGDGDAVVVEKSFEGGAVEASGDAFVVYGLVEKRLGNTIESAQTSELFVSRSDASSSVSQSIRIVPESTGDFRVTLPLPQDEPTMDVDITIVGDGAVRSDSYTIRNGKPLQINGMLSR